MRAQRFDGERFEWRETPTPEPGPGEVRVAIEACGICGTDLHWLHGGLIAPGHQPGHEMVGRVDALGPEVAAQAPGLQAGQRVAVEPIDSCGQCPACLAGRDSICRTTKLFGIHLPGGFAEAVCVPARRLFPIDETLAPEVAALAEPVAVAVHGLLRGRLARDERVLVLGAGSVGLVSLVAARALGAGEVVVSARHPAQAALAQELGATRVLSEEEASPEALARLSREVDFDLVVETVGGRADTLLAAGAAARPGGRVSVLGVFLGPVQLDALALVLKEIELFGSNCYQRAAGAEADFAVAVRLVEEERERLARLTTHQLPLAELQRGFALAGDKAGGAVKVTMVAPSPTLESC